MNMYQDMDVEILRRAGMKVLTSVKLDKMLCDSVFHSIVQPALFYASEIWAIMEREPWKNAYSEYHCESISKMK